MQSEYKSLVGGILIAVATVLPAVQPGYGYEMRLTVHPQKVPAEPGTHALLPTQASLIDGDAVVWYEKAAAALPKDVDSAQVRKWLEMPIDQLPQQQVEQVLVRHMESLRHAAKGVRCRQCNWPAWAPGTDTMHKGAYRELAFAIRLWVRLELARGQFPGALVALQTGYGMARHLGQAPTILQTLVGANFCELMCREIEQFVQMRDAPNLHAALAALPRPFVDVEQAIANEQEMAGSSQTGVLADTAVKSQMQRVYDRVRMNLKRLDVHLAVLQCVEAIRSYAASHAGQLPQSLSDIGDLAVPKDPTNGEPFRYTRTGSKAVLDSAVPEGGDSDHSFHCEILLEDGSR
jgi:hypothetical protein